MVPFSRSSVLSAAGPFQERDAANAPSFAPRAALVLAAWFGLVAGYLDLGMIFLKRDLLHAMLYYEQGRHFRWGVPLASLAIMMVPGLLVAVLNGIRPGLLSRRNAAWALATLTIWGPLLRAPLYGAATLILAAGAARPIAGWLARHDPGFRRCVRYSLPVLAALVGATAMASFRAQSLAASKAEAQLPAPPAGADNVILIVLDTVRAESLGLYGYARDTTPHLARWARKGVRFDWAMAPAPWTFPSHASFLTGQWPRALEAHWRPTLNPAFPTVAEYLAGRGYATSGFAANTFWCSYESEMDRGFGHYEDYPLSPRGIFGSTMPGRWILENLWSPRDYYAVKWIRSQSRDAEGINRSFLEWLSHNREPGRPFFAFLNYLDAHEPFLPPEDGTHFGLRPRSAAESRMLLEYWDRDKLALSAREVELARDAYDDCIAALDRQIGALLDELERRGALADTHVLVTSDHGEQFGEHGVFNHGFSLYAHEIHVPLLIISRAAPAGCTVSDAVSLRDLPATIVDLLGLAGGSPFPGRSLAESWRTLDGTDVPQTSPAFSEVDIPVVIIPQRGRGPSQRGFTVSLAALGLHYLLDVHGVEELFDLNADPLELRNLKNDAGHAAQLARFRDALAVALRDHPATAGAAVDYQKRLRMWLDQMTPRRPEGTL
jgi:arylsulfatase A-like enzyme